MAVRPAADGPVLVLGGTAEGFALAGALDAAGVAVISSLAGRVANPKLPPGEVRIGPFGGPDGLVDFLRARGVAAVVDATHPFARSISANARQAAAVAEVPLLRLARPTWQPLAEDRWTYVDTVAQAADRCGGGRRVFLTIGRQGLEHFAAVGDSWFLVRCVEPPAALPPSCELLLSRGPFTPEGELRLLRRHRIDLLVTKESGGSQTEAKLIAARTAGVEVVVIRRPPDPSAKPTVSRVEDAFAWAMEIVSRRRSAQDKPPVPDRVAAPDQEGVGAASGWPLTQQGNGGVAP